VKPTKPVLQALILADHVYTDRGTGKNVIAGTFNQLWANQFPSKLGRSAWAFFCLTDLKGKVVLSLKYINLSNNEVLMQLDGIEATCKSPLQSVEYAVELPPIPMPDVGAYAFELYAGTEMLGALRVNVARLGDK